MRVFFAVVAFSALLAGTAVVAKESEAIGRAMKDRVVELEALVRKLEAVLEGEARPVNLARTNLAAVSASSVNGSRELDNCFYGIRNAFDDGTNVVNNIHYTYWLTSGEPSPWVDVEFDEPVSVSGFFVEGANPYVARLFAAKGGEVDYGPSTGKLDLPRLEHGIRRVRLTFSAGGNARVHEIRVFGHPHPETGVEECIPRIARNASLDSSRSNK